MRSSKEIFFPIEKARNMFLMHHNSISEVKDFSSFLFGKGDARILLLACTTCLVISIFLSELGIFKTLKQKQHGKVNKLQHFRSPESLLSRLSLEQDK